MVQKNQIHLLIVVIVSFSNLITTIVPTFFNFV